MPSTCVVPGCKGNYRSGPKVQVFSFPKEPELHKKWLHAIRRQNFTPTKNSKVCELHFNPCDIRKETVVFDESTGREIRVTLMVPRLVEGAIPSQLPNCPSYLSGASFSRESPETKRTRIEQTALATALADSILVNKLHTQRKTFQSLVELKTKIDFIDSKFWSVVEYGDNLALCHIVFTPCPKVKFSLVFNASLNVTAFIGGNTISHLGAYQLPITVNDVNVVEELMHHLSLLGSNSDEISDGGKAKLKLAISIIKSVIHLRVDNCRALEFVCEQIQLMTVKRLIHSSETLIFSALLCSVSPAGYRMLRDSGFLILPSESTIRRVTLSKSLSPAVEQSDGNFLVYIKQKCKLLNAGDLVVSLLIDEIHLKPFYDYKGGNVIGCAFDDEQPASSAYVFMINSVFSPFKDVVHIVPTKAIKAESLCSFLKKVILGLEHIGFKVICVVTDNNAINKKALSLLTSPPKLSIAYPHPSDITRPLFFLFDSVHILKCIRNNWLAQKDFDKSMVCPYFPFDDEGVQSPGQKLTAPFNTLKKLHSLESDQLLKFSYNLTMKALCPSNLEKQNVKLVLQVFNEYVVQGLLSLAKKENLPFCEDTAKYIKIFLTWWTIMNVKTPFKGVRLNNVHAKPLTDHVNNESMVFLSKFLDWLDDWETMDLSSGKLSKETHCALKHTTHAIMELTKYCSLELQMSYVLPGKFQTDCLESRFGKYRQLSGSHYNISVRQVFESEQKLRLMSMLELALPFQNQTVTLKTLATNWNEMTEECVQIIDFDIDVSEGDIAKCNEYIPVITYLAGYCCYSVNKKMKCEFCKYLLIDNDDQVQCWPESSYIKGLDRGGLLYPHCVVVNIVLFNYIVVEKLSKEQAFLRATNQRAIAVNVTFSKLIDEDVFLLNGHCEGGHLCEKIVKMVIWASTNALLNNFCRRENDVIFTNKCCKVKKRKLQTLS